ncbi:MAG: FKBP-type peptidyl-prolyl cis-trans isomerase [Prolixibacteraceae bacterium]|nr:FKBP-type peptidyl-prolyl cis-trans isomerase [Prolixibacteraceae bacterium]
MKRILTSMTVVLIALAIFSCKENDAEKQREYELKKLSDYIQNNYPDLKPKASGLYYIEQVEGEGDSIKIGDKVQVFYDIWDLDSTHLTSSGRFEPLEFVVLSPTQLSYLAEDVNEMLGLHEAVTYMKKGTKSLLILPSELAFGQYGITGVISGFTSLLMEVEIYKVYPYQTAGTE